MIIEAKTIYEGVIYLSESHDHRSAKTIDEGGPLMSMIDRQYSSYCFLTSELSI